MTETPNIYIACVSCAEARATGNFAEAAGCRWCKGTGFRRTRESWTCNACGGCLCPDTKSMNCDIPHGLIDARVDGGYDSPALRDCTSYRFSMCEACLRKLFDSFKIGPIIGEYMLGGGGGVQESDEESYEDEATGMQHSEQERELDKRIFAELREQKKCADRVDRFKHGSPYCAEPGICIVDFESRDTDAGSDEWRHWVCRDHARNVYASHGTRMVFDGETWTWAQRREFALELVGRIRGASAPSEQTTLSWGQPERECAVSACLPLLLAGPEHRELADQWLAWLTGTRPPTDVPWYSSHIPLAFGPSNSRPAAMVNAWLVWARERGYGEAAAFSHFAASGSDKERYSPEGLWRE